MITPCVRLKMDLLNSKMTAFCRGLYDCCCECFAARGECFGACLLSISGVNVMLRIHTVSSLLWFGSLLFGVMSCTEMT